MSPEALARMDAMTDEEITRAAESDPDNPPLTEEEFLRIDTVKAIRRARAATELSSEAFADTYSIAFSHVQDMEGGRVTADAPMFYYLRHIAADPEGVRREVAQAA